MLAISTVIQSNA